MKQTLTASDVTAGPPRNAALKASSVQAVAPHYSTGAVAKICGISQQTVIRCFDAGSLGGFKVPGTKFRRIPREALLKFMLENGIPTDALGALSDEERAEVARRVMGPLKLSMPNRLEGVQLAALDDAS